MTQRVLITGAAGYLGSTLVSELARRAAGSGDPGCIVATDVREGPPERRLSGVQLGDSIVAGTYQTIRDLQDSTKVRAMKAPAPDAEKK
mgnify:CR=1 FL=1